VVEAIRGLTAMLDINYLLERPRVDQTIIYRYRSGILRPKLRGALSDLASETGAMLAGCEPSGLSDALLGSSLLETITVCEWAEADGSLWRSPPDSLLALLASPGGASVALFVPANAPLLRQGAWPQIEAVCFVIEEPRVTRETLLPVLRYLGAMTDLAVDPDLVEQEAFLATFEELLEGSGTELPVIIRHFDETILTCTNRTTKAFDSQPRDTEALRQRGRTSPMQLLRSFVASKDGWDLVQLVVALEQRYRDGLTGQALISELYRATEGLIRQAARGEQVQERFKPGPETQGASVADSALWAGVLLAWEERLSQSSPAAAIGLRRGPNLLITLIDQLGRDYAARAELPTEGGRLDGLWPQIRWSLNSIALQETDPLAGPRMRLVQALHEVLLNATGRTVYPWLDRLKEGTAAALAEAERRHAEPCREECA
jgi:hypothetical protein